MEPIIDWIKIFGFRIIEVVRWFCKKKKVWITLLPFIGAYLLFWHTSVGTLGDRFRFTGLTLELFGIGAVAYGIKETLNSFGRTLKEFLKLRDNSPVVVSMNGRSILSALTVSGFGTPLAPNSSVKDRVTFLEELLKQVQLQAHENRKHFENEFKKSTDTLNTERSEREASVEKVRQMLEKFAVDGLAIELMGVVWLLFGAISATLSIELACFFDSFPALLIC
jgi:hypothetical protein